MLTYFLDKHLKTPLYEQLYTYIKESILDDELKADEKLPSKRKLAQHLKISVMTVENAYNQLMAEGYIKSKPKSGYFVLPVMAFASFTQQVPKDTHIKPLKKEKYVCDFRTNLVDETKFPYDQLAKISKSIIQDRFYQTINQTHHLGDIGLREQIAHMLCGYRGIVAKPESIVIGSGSEHLISLLVLLLGRDKVFGVEEPGYLKNYKLYRDYGAISQTFEIVAEGVNVETLKGINVVHMTPSHQFPLGIVTPISKRIELLNWSNEAEDRYIIEDDYDSEFRFSGKPIPALKSLDHMDKVIYLNSFSKSLAPSFRVSFMVLPDHLMNLFNAKFSYLNCTVPLITQLTVKRFIETQAYDRHVARMKNMYKMKRDCLISLIKQSRFSQKITIKGEDSGLHFLMEVDTTYTTRELIQKAEVVHVRVYGIHEYYLKHHDTSSSKIIIMGYAHLDERAFKQAISLLEDAWHDI